MGRLCERPGCSEVAAVAYGMRTEDLVFWIDTIGESNREGGMLCRRHGDSMVVPRGWTLDDLRDPDLHLFRPPPRPDGPATTRRRRSAPHHETGVEQLSLGGVLDAEHAVQAEIIVEVTDADSLGTIDAGAAATDDAPEPVAAAVESPDASHSESAQQHPVDAEPDEAAVAWKPAFDNSDDLNGLLAARSPLLSRAFRGGDRAG